VNEFKGIVLANSSLRPELPSFACHHAPELVSVADKPILFHALEAMRDAGVAEIALIVDPHRGEAIREAVGDGSEWALRAHYVPSSNPGILDSVQAAEQVLGRAQVVVYPGNGILMAPIRPMLRRFQRAHLQALVPPVEQHHDSPDSGIYVFAKSVHDAARSTDRSWRGQLELSDVIATLLRNKGRVEARPMVDWWSYHGHRDELLEANRLVLDHVLDRREVSSIKDSTLEGRISISASADIEATTIRGPSIIGPGARVIDAHIGPYTTIGRLATVRGAEVENSIIMAGAIVEDVGTRISRSVIGENAILNRDFSMRRVLELAVAHGSTATLS
jgi:glucose-1-phosphate thymidylyltransferase